MAEQGFILDIDTQFIERLKKADQSLGSMIRGADNLTESLKKAFNSVNGSNIDIISRIATQWDSLGKQKLKLNADTSGIERLTSLLNETIHTMQAFSKGGVELFNTDNIYSTTKSLFELNEELSAVEKRITELQAEWDGDIFEPPINEKTGKPWSRGSKAYKAAREAWEADKEGRADKDEIAVELSLLAERKAILQEELRWSKMTQDERAEYTKKKIQSILNEEQKHNKAVIAEYRKTINEMLGIMRETDRLNKKNEGGVVSPEIQQLNTRFAQLNQERIAMEQNYGNIIVEVAEEANAKAVKIYAERKLTEERLRKEAEEKEWQAYLSTPEGALQLAADAKTINEMKEAQKYLQTARGNVDSTKDRKLIDELNASYTRLRITIEDLTAAEKNEHALQPSVRNEYIRLLRELEKIQDARDRMSETESFMNADAQAYTNYNNLLKRERDIQEKIKSIRENSIVESEGKRINLLEETDRAYLAEKAQRELSETERLEKEKADKIRARYKEIVDELRQLQHEGDRISDLESKYGYDFDASESTHDIADRQRELNREREEIERDHQDKITDIQEAASRKRLKDDIDRAEKAARQAIEARKSIEKEEDEYRSTYRGAMDYSANTKSIHEQIQAIKYLKEARDKLDRTQFSSNKEYKAAVQRLTNEIERQTLSVKILRGELESTSKVSGQIKTALTNMFGLAAIKGYVNQLIRVRGEFEMQRKSLSVLLNSKAQSNLLWEQTLALAIKSPYEVKDLVKATKQLAAYRIEQHKLHSTTKMLADISSGLGVEIDRLILAFGQVKAANFLRGTELRQFSEAGINILDELADHYSNLEGRMVSVGEVFERVSKRMVTFADVETVLKQAVSEGGTFFNMQEEQAETLLGKVRNLKDRLNIMYDEIGGATNGTIVNFIELFGKLAENWRILAKLIMPVISALITYKGVMLLAHAANSLYNKGLAIAAGTAHIFGRQVQSSSRAVRMLNIAMARNPFMFWMSVVATIGSTIMGAVGLFADLEEEVVDTTNVVTENTATIKNLAGAILNLTQERNELLGVAKRTEAQERRLENVNKALSTSYGELKQKNEEYAKSLRGANGDIEAMANAMEKQNSRLEAQNAIAFKLSNIDWDKLAKASSAGVKATQSAAAAKVSWDNKFFNLDRLKLVNTSDYNKLPLEAYKAMKEFNGDVAQAYDYLAEQLEVSHDDIKTAFSNLAALSHDERLKQAMVAYADARKQLIETDTTSADAKEMADLFIKTNYVEGLKDALLDSNEEISNAAKHQLNASLEEAFRASGKEVPEEFRENVKKAVGASLGLGNGWWDAKDLSNLLRWQKEYNKAVRELKSIRDFPLLKEIDDASTSMGDIIQQLDELIAKEKEVIAIHETASTTPFEKVVGKSFAPNSTPGGITSVSVAPLVTAEEAKISEENLAFLNALRSLLGSIKITRSGGGGGGSSADKGIKLLNVVKELYSAYDDLSNKTDDVTAKDKLWEQYTATVKSSLSGTGVSVDALKKQIENFDIAGVEALLKMKSRSLTAAAKREFEMFISELKLDKYLEEQSVAYDSLMKDVENMFTGYEIGLELEELHLPKDFAKNLFDIDILDFDALRNNITKLKGAFDDYGTEGEKAYAELLRRIADIEDKQQVERLKKYAKFHRQSLGERTKILLEGLNEIQDIENSFIVDEDSAVKDGIISQEALDKLKAKNKSLQDVLSMEPHELRWFGLETGIQESVSKLYSDVEKQKENALDISRANTQSRLDKLDWDLFRTSDTFTMIMEDIDIASEKAIGQMIDQLENYKEQWKDMPVSDMKQLIDAINKLKAAQSGFHAPREYKKDLKSYLKNGVEVEGETFKFDSVGDAYSTLVSSEATIGHLTEELSIIQQIALLREQKKEDSEILDYLNKQGIKDGATINKLLKTSANDQEKLIDGKKREATAAKQVISTVKNTVTAYDKQAERIQDVQRMTDALFDGWNSINSLFEEDSISSELASMSQSILGGVLSTILMQGELFNATLAAQGFGAALNAAMGPIGWIVLGIQALTTILSFAFKQHDKNIQKQMDAEIEAVETLKEKYEELEKQLEKAYQASEIGRITREMNDNLQNQIDKTKELKALEEDKKKVDKDAVKGYDDEIKDLESQMTENIENTFSTLTDGILDNVLDATRSFVDAWHDAYEEAGDGMKGLEEAFNDMLKNMLRQQAATQLVSLFTDKYKTWLSEYVNAENDPELTAEEARAWADRVKETFPELNELLGNFFEGTQGLLETGGELSGLEKGIQGMTEEQAEVLAAYWNSCRFMLSNIDTNLAAIAASVLGGANNSNPVVEAIQAQTLVITDIKNMFESIIGSTGYPSGGSYIKTLEG